tara:strand:- start:1122 stop:1856 length:735 start_codon:yes stop_codon:yes gene_type:complete
MNDQQMLLLERFVQAAEGLELTMKNIEGILGRFLARPDSLEMLQEAKSIVSIKEEIEVQSQKSKSGPGARKKLAKISATKAEELVHETVDTDPEDIQAGIRVLIASGDAKDGIVGTCVSRNIAWAKVLVEKGNGTYDKGETLAIRPKFCKILAGDENPTKEQLEEAAVELPTVYIQPSDPEHPGNLRFDKGTYVGQTVHEIYEDRGEMAVKFFKFAINSNIYKNTAHGKAVLDYCKLRGVDLSE